MVLDTATKIFMLYTGLTGAIFFFVPSMPVKETFGDLSGQEFLVARVYSEVIGGLSLALFVGTCPGAMGVLLSSMCWILTMAKHILVDNLQPPMPVLIMATSCVAINFYSVKTESKLGKRVFMAFNALNAFMFFTNPGQVLADSFPSVSAGSNAYKYAVLLIEVVATHCVCQILTQCPPPLGRAMAMTALLGLVAKHNVVDNFGPPLPVLGLMVVCAAAQYYAVATKKRKAKPA